MQMSWRFPPRLAARLGLVPAADGIYTLSSVEFAGRMTTMTGRAFGEALRDTERQYQVLRLAAVAAASIMQRPGAAALVMESGGFQVFPIVDLVDPKAGAAWLTALFAVYVERRFARPARIASRDFAAWARVLSATEICAIAASELHRASEGEVQWLLMDEAARLYRGLQEALALPDRAAAAPPEEMTIPAGPPGVRPEPAAVPKEGDKLNGKKEEDL